MKISPQEQEAIITVLTIADQYGYGNIIAHLKSAWAKSLIDNYQISEQTAFAATNVTPYPIAVHQYLIDRKLI